MGKQDGVIQLTGAVGNLSFYKTPDGYMARKKNTVSPDRIQSDPAYERTRENMAEFTRAGQATRLLRNVFRTSIQAAADYRMTGRLTRAMMKVVHADTVNIRGKRNVIDGEAVLLEGFEFNRNAVLAKTFIAPYGASIDRAAGTLVIDIPAFSPKGMIVAPQGSTHFRLKTGGAAIDFSGGGHSHAASETEALSLSQAVQGPIQLTQTVEAGAHPLFLIFGVEFLQLVNGVQYPLKNGAHNAMAIVKVDGGE